MIVKFVHDVELEVVLTFDEETDTPDVTSESFKAGEEVDFDIFDEDKELGTVDVQFGDGAVAYGIRTEWYEVIEQ